MNSSGDLLGDRRYAYAEGAFKDGDLGAAVDLARQALELAPGFAPAWLLLGQAHEAVFRQDGGGPDVAGHYRDAVAAYQSADALDPDGRLGARLRLAALGIGDPDGAMQAGYVRALFDDYAIRFDRHLVRSLKYRAPELLHGAVRRVCSRALRPFAFSDAVDLGCGTGLAGECFRGECERLAGIDLSPAMLAKAEAKRLYDELAAGEILDWMRGRPDGSAELLLAADVFVYLGELGPVFAEAARLLVPGGLLAFTVQAHEGHGVQLGDDLRYAHSESYLCSLAMAHGLAVALLEPGSTREDRGEPVPGLILVLERT